MTSVNPKQEALLDELLKDYTDPRDILGEHGLLKHLTRRVVERAREAELTAHLGYEPHARQDGSEGNSRNGKGQKIVQTDTGQFTITVPRDCNSSFAPQLAKKRQRRLAGFDDKVLSLYARGWSTREIQAHLEALYGVEGSSTLLSHMTDAVLEEVRAWQARPLASVYPILYFDALCVKSRQEGPVQTKAVYLALGLTLAGEKELLGRWLSESEGAKCWLAVFTELKNRGVEDCCIACVDGLKGLPNALEVVCPKTQVQLCSVHKVRNSLRNGIKSRGIVFWKHLFPICHRRIFQYGDFLRSRKVCISDGVVHATHNLSSRHNSPTYPGKHTSTCLLISRFPPTH
jgi:transposase-like protein